MNQPQKRKIIIAVAPVGKNIKPPAVNPLNPDQVAAEVIACTRAGAGLVHLHVRDDKGDQTERLDGFSKTLDLIRASSDIVIEGSTGGLTSLSLEERCVALNDPRVEVATLNMGSVNFSEDVYINRLSDIRYWAGRMQETGVLPDLAIFEVGMLQVAKQFIAENIITPPYAFGLCLGFHWALPPVPESLFFFKTLLGQDAGWGMVHDGMRDFSLLATAIGMGASLVRVGFEDSPFYAPGSRANSNAELVERLAALVRRMGCAVATPAETRQMLGIGKSRKSRGRAKLSI